MVLGYLIATGIETVFELGFWSIRKTATAVYGAFYGEEEEEEIKMSEIKELKKEINELKELILKRKEA